MPRDHVPLSYCSKIKIIKVENLALSAVYRNVTNVKEFDKNMMKNSFVESKRTSSKTHWKIR